MPHFIFPFVFSSLLVLSLLYFYRKAVFFTEKKHRKKIFLLVFFFHVVILSGFLAPRLYPQQKQIPFFLHAIEWVSYCFLGFLSFVGVLFFLVDIYYLFSNLIFPPQKPVDASKRKLFYTGAFAVASAMAGKAFYNAIQIPEIKNVLVPLTNLPQELWGLKIVQLTDLHIGQTIGIEFLQEVVNLVNDAKPDIVAITGDIADGFVTQIQHLMAPLSQIKSTYGVYYVTGNHEYYWHGKEWVEHLKSLGAVPLQNEHVVLNIQGKKMIVAGVNDLSARNFPGNSHSSAASALKGVPEDATLKLLLAHQPKSAFEAAQVGFHLQLSGHTHGGQYWPGTWIIPFIQPFVKGLSEHNGMKLYVSCGTGYWGPPARLGTSSEITVLTLKSA